MLGLLNKYKEKKVRSDEDPLKMAIEVMDTRFLKYNKRTLAPFLPMLFLDGKPLSFKYHYPMLPFFKLKRPRRTVFMCGRQEGKSVSLAAGGILRSRAIPYYYTLFVQPRFDQIKRFSNTYVSAMFNDSPFRNMLLDTQREQSIKQRSLSNGSSMYFSYAFLSPDASRGICASELAIDEVQDINAEFIPILASTMDAQTKYGFHMYSGTPKEPGNTLNQAFLKSSQAHYHVFCDHCNYENIPNADNHIYRMIGKNCPICAKCGKPLDIRISKYIHHYPDRRSSYEGYHIPQIIHPLHALFPAKWAELRYKMENWSHDKFANEILGLPAENTFKPITEAELRDACSDRPNNMAYAVTMAKKASISAQGTDWSGFGADNTSTTCTCIAAQFPNTDILDILYLERLPTGTTPQKEAVAVRNIFHNFAATHFAHDNSGAGVIREALASQMGIPGNRMVPFTIVSAPARKAIIELYQPPNGGPSSFTIDKTRSLMVLYAMIKARKIRFPSWESCKYLLKDLMNIEQETREMPRGSDLLIMNRTEGTTDDMAHAINFASSALWYRQGKYPALAEAAPIPMDIMAEVDPIHASAKGYPVNPRDLEDARGMRNLGSVQ